MSVTVEKTISAGSDEKQLKYESSPVNVEPATQKRTAGHQSRLAALSPYMTIAAAGFGLISDGCEYLISILVDFDV